MNIVLLRFLIRLKYNRQLVLKEILWGHYYMLYFISIFCVLVLFLSNTLTKSCLNILSVNLMGSILAVRLNLVFVLLTLHRGGAWAHLKNSGYIF